MSEFTKIDAKTLERMMLHDAISWQEGLVDAVRGSEDHPEALAILKQYRALFRRRYGSTKSALDVMLEGAELVNIMDLMHPVNDPAEGG